MTVSAPLLTRRAVLQCAIEAEYREEATVGINDALYVEEPDYAVDVNLLERNFARDDLSPLPNIVGRRLASMTFTTELKGSGAQNSGQLADAPLIARLFRACGYSLTAMGAPDSTVVFPVGNHTVEVEWDVNVDTASHTDVINYVLEVTTPGPSGTAQITVSSDTPGQGSNTPATPATGSIVFSDQPAAASTVTINGVAFTFVDTAPATNTEVEIGGNLATTLNNLRDALNASVNASVSPATYAATGGTTLTVTHDTAGTAGNAFTLVAGAGSNGTASGATLTGGTAASGAVTVTSGTGISLGTSGIEVTPTFADDLKLGTKWVIWALPQGLRLDPISDEFESLTMVLNMDGVQHKMLGSFGTFTITAEAGDYARIEWEFQGTWINPIDVPMPICNYEKSLPAQVELARLRVDGDYIIVNAFNYTQANDIQIRPDVSSAEGYVGTRIVSRAPEGGIDPEAELVANHDFWGKMGAAERMSLQMRVGTQAGNTVWFLAPSIQYTGLTYQDRNGIRTYDAQLRFSRVLGNDELCIVLC